MESRHLAACGLICLASAIAGCSRQQTDVTVPADQADAVIPICDLPHRVASLDGQQARVRGRLLAGAHEIFLTDESTCPEVTLYLKHTPNGPNVNLCSYPELVAKFGCPGGNDNGPVVTTQGRLRKGRLANFAFMDVEKMTDFRTLDEARSEGR